MASTHEEAVQEVFDHMLEPLPAGHGMPQASIDTTDVVRYHTYLHRHAHQITHEHKRPQED